MWKRRLHLVRLTQSTMDNRLKQWRSRQMNYWTAIPRSNWPGLKVSACMCLRYNYALPLIPAAPHVTSGLEVNIQGVLWMDTMRRAIQKPEEQRDAGEEHSLRYETPYRFSPPSLPLITLSGACCTDSAHILPHFQHPLPASRTNLLCLKPRMSTSMLGLALGAWNHETCLNH